MPRYAVVTVLLALIACGDGKPATSPAKPALEEPAADSVPPRKSAQRPEPAPEQSVAAAPPTQPAAPPPPEFSLDATLRLNQVQMKGTHNSYHLRPDEFVSAAADYDMPPLDDQLTRYGVRAFELDLHWAHERFEVYHRQGDANSTCLAFADCIEILRAWSTAHPRHLPLIVLLELKTDTDTAGHLEELEALLADRWPREGVFTPDDFRWSSPSLKAALQDHGWPPLADVRGKAIFVLMATRDVLVTYAHDDAGLDGRRMFPFSGDTVWRHGVFLDYDVLTSAADIGYAVALGYMVRTRGDDVPTAGDDYPARFQKALDSGAQLVFTDYPAPEASEGYDADMPGGTPARCDPVTAPPECAPELLENPSRLVLPYP